MMEDFSDTIRNICGIPKVTEPVVDNSKDEDEGKTFLDYFQENIKIVGDQKFFTQPMGNDVVMEWTYKEVLEEAKKVAGYIQSLGFPEKSQIAIMSKNCAWWIIADIGIWLSGHISVPVFPGLTTDTTKYTLEHSESKLLFVGKLDEKPWQEQKKGIPGSLPTISFPLSPENSAHKTWKETIASHTPIQDPVNPKPEAMATIIYTSGSTGL
jgi:long-chain acyl-CoA synthetase